MPDFFHAPTCMCGNCFPDSDAADPINHYTAPCGCEWNDGEMYFCELHDVEDYAETKCTGLGDGSRLIWRT